MNDDNETMAVDVLLAVIGAGKAARLLALVGNLAEQAGDEAIAALNAALAGARDAAMALNAALADDDREWHDLESPDADGWRFGGQ